jgi:GAF domain-containing protein
MDVRTLAAVANLLSVARRRARAQAGTVYRRDADGLRFLVTQNDELARPAGHAAGVGLLTRSELRWTEPSIASYVALTQTTLNIPDAYDIPPSRPYAFNRRFDMMTGFRTVSMLVVPLHSPLLGVLQLLNATNGRGEVVPFSDEVEHAVESLAARTAVSV